MKKTSKILPQNYCQWENQTCQVCGNRGVCYAVCLHVSEYTSFTVLTCYDCERLEPETLIKVVMANADELEN